MKFRLLNQQTIDALHRYKYAGGDLSKIYKYILSPFAEWGVNFMPRWLAPNIITLIGLIFVILTHAMMAWYSPGFDGDPPRWTFILCALGLFLYSWFDNMDGKQARRTGSSSPLGMLFDHGCDAVNSTVSTVTFICAMQLGALENGMLMAFGFWLAVTTAFYFATWEEYHVGEMWLPVINGPSEGIILTELCHLTSAVMGPAFWADKAHLVLALALGACAVTLAVQMYSTAKFMWARGRSFVPAVARMLTWVTLVVGGFAWMALSPALASAHPRLMFALLGTAFAECVTRLMLAHIIESEYDAPWHAVLPVAAGAANALWAVVFECPPPVNEAIYLTACVVFTALSYAALVYLVITELSVALGITWYSVQKRSA